MKHDSYCTAPFEHIYVEKNDIRPCCWWKPSKEIPAVNSGVDPINISSVVNNPKLHEIRKGMISGEKLPPNCIQCQTHEDLGGKSHRHQHNLRARNVYSYTEEHSIQPAPRIKTMEINLGNLCNLACVMCGSHNSTKWWEDEVPLYGIKKGQLRTSFGDKFIQSDTIENVLDIDRLDWNLLENIEGIKLAGGENLMMPQHKRLIEILIEKGLSPNINLQYVVNGTHDPYEFIDYWKKFKLIHIIISLDGIGDPAEYIRYHTVWNKVDENVQKYFQIYKENNNFLITTNTTVSLSLIHI